MALREVGETTMVAFAFHGKECTIPTADCVTIDDMEEFAQTGKEGGLELLKFLVRKYCGEDVERQLTNRSIRAIMGLMTEGASISLGES